MVDFALTVDKKDCLIEECSNSIGNHSVLLNKKEMFQFAEEIKGLAEGMVE